MSLVLRESVEGTLAVFQMVILLTNKMHIPVKQKCKVVLDRINDEVTFYSFFAHMKLWLVHFY